ncbi:MAG: UDP-3-O-(3-hydroxymyristoyl)glucosamine N-acyltransferase [Flavobacteriaceae bacterium]|nr:UDP-3-O-(3-hydroxymyristoyl)glucosamine N-acyltransferase [Flavobacteriaceae bacterium]|tara:strand:+ start:2081 stop:2545 length:465 start_codon:yes stop_codon:yes gene_type:complete
MVSNKPKILKVDIKDSVFGKDCTISDIVNIYGATFGDNCFVGPYTEIQNNVIIGSNVRIQSHSLICEGMRVGNNVFIGHGVMTANSSYPVAGKKDWECNSPKIGNNVSIGSGAIILPGVVIEDNANIGAGAIVSKNVNNGETIIKFNESFIKSS